MVLETAASKSPNKTAAPITRIRPIVSITVNATTKPADSFISLTSTAPNKIRMSKTTTHSENKTTLNGVSSYDTIAWPESRAEIRLCRIDSQFYLLIRAIGGSWQTLVNYDRPDLPAELQIGMMGYADSNADLALSFEYFRFSAAQTLSDCSLS